MPRLQKICNACKAPILEPEMGVEEMGLVLHRECALQTLAELRKIARASAEVPGTLQVKGRHSVKIIGAAS